MLTRTVIWLSILVLVLTLIILYIVISYFTRWWPFNNCAQEDAPTGALAALDSNPPKQASMGSYIMGFLIFAVFALIIGLVIYSIVHAIKMQRFAIDQAAKGNLGVATAALQSTAGRPYHVSYSPFSPYGIY